MPNRKKALYFSFQNLNEERFVFPCVRPKEVTKVRSLRVSTRYCGIDYGGA